MSEYSRISEPGNIGKLEIRNRVSMSPMEKQWADRLGNPPQFYVDYMAERARHGVGMITMESTFVDPRGRGNIFQLGLWDDSNVEHHRKLTDAVRAHGTRAATELMHVGRQGATYKIGLQPEAQSAVPCEVSGGYLPRRIEHEEIARIRENFRKAARRAVEAGYDMITIHGAHGYLITGFLSPRFNQRNDEYGGSEENRWRFPREVYEVIREEVGDDVPVGFRLSADEDVEGGLTVAHSIAFIQKMTELGLDYVDVSAGVYESAPTIIQPMDLPEGVLLPIAKEMKRSLDIPVIAAGRINTMDLAERALEAGDADFVHMGRAFHCDPEIYEKAVSGRSEETIRCIGCNKCIGTVFSDNRMVCTVNPVAGREREMPLRPAEKPRRVMVVGGGMAGMEVAATAAQRGHSVTLYEKSDGLGGHLRVLSASKHRRSWWNAAEDRMTKLRTAGVKVVTGTEVAPEHVSEAKPEVLVLATGSKPFMPPYIPGIEQPIVTDYQALTNGTMKPGRNVVVMGGQELGLTVAEYLSEHGAKVTVVDDSAAIGRDLEGITAAVMLPRIEADPNIAVRVQTNIEAIGPDHVVVQCGGQTETISGVDQVVYAWHRDMERDLVEKVSGPFRDQLGLELHVIGDAVWPRHPYDAVNEGTRLGRLI